MQLNCPTVGIFATNKTNDTLIRDNLYQDNTSMIEFFSQQVNSALMHVYSPICIICADLKVFGSRPNLHFPAYGFWNV